MNQGDQFTIHHARQADSQVWFAGPGFEDLAVFAERHGAVWVAYDQAVAGPAQELMGLFRAHGIRVLGAHALAIEESMKSMTSLVQLYGHMADDQVTRDALVVAIGGGVLTDLVGFAAATYLRGLPWVAVPTTLLAQVDAAIGGKVAVNLPAGKNLVGAFHLPHLVYINPELLTSLPADGWRTGLGEVIKSALIAGGPLWQSLSETTPQVGLLNDHWRFIIQVTATIKIEVVNRDMEEQGDRIFLNFGHTLAHALEQTAGYGQWSHGQAVALGSLMALYLSEQYLGLDPTIRQTVQSWLQQWGLPSRLPALDYKILEPVLMRDKKARQFGLQWVLLQALGHPLVVRDVDPTMIARGLVELGPPGHST